MADVGRRRTAYEQVRKGIRGIAVGSESAGPSSSSTTTFNHLVTPDLGRNHPWTAYGPRSCQPPPPSGKTAPVSTAPALTACPLPSLPGRAVGQGAPMMIWSLPGKEPASAPSAQ